MLTRAEQDVEMTARLYDCRSAARGILGSSYVTTLQPWRDLIGRVMHAKHLSVLQAVIDIGKHVDGDGMSLMLVMAAGVELIESPPSLDAGDPVPGVVAEVRRATDDSSSLLLDSKGLPSAAPHPARTEEPSQ